MISVLVPFRRSHPSREMNLNRCLKHLVGTFEGSGIGEVEFLVSDDPDPTSFNRGRALNAGMEGAKGRVLVFMDADLLLPPEALLKAIELAPAMPGYVVPFTSISFLGQLRSSQVVRELIRPFAPWRIADLDRLWEKRSTGTCNVLHRRVWDAVGGFDPRFRGWGFEDTAWEITCRTLVGPTGWLEARGTHLWHPTAKKSNSPLHIASRNLRSRYSEVDGDPDAIRALIAERKGI